MNDIAKEALFRRCADQCDTQELSRMYMKAVLVILWIM